MLKTDLDGWPDEKKARVYSPESRPRASSRRVATRCDLRCQTSVIRPPNNNSPTEGQKKRIRDIERESHFVSEILCDAWVVKTCVLLNIVHVSFCAKPASAWRFLSTRSCHSTSCNFEVGKNFKVDRLHDLPLCASNESNRDTKTATVAHILCIVFFTA